MDTSHDPVVTYSDSVTFSDYKETQRLHERIQGDTTCISKALPYNPADASQTTDGCWYDTSVGALEENGRLIMPKGSAFVGLVEHASQQLIATPNPDVFIELTPISGEDSSHYYIDFRVGDAASMIEQASALDEGIASYTWPSGAQFTRLKDFDGQPMVVDDNVVYSQIAYSNNGRYMALWNGRGYVTEIDLASSKLTTQFARVDVVPEDAEDHFANMSISDNGRYMAIVAYDDVAAQPLRIVDFNNCADTPGLNNLNMPFCSLRYLDGAVGAVMPAGDTYTSGLALFYNDDLLEYYVTNSKGGYDTYAIRAPNTLRTDYIALGDSYASGEGEGGSTYYPETNIHDLNMCHLSRYSYPILLGGDIGLSSTHSVACSGATTLNILGNGVFDDHLEDPNRTNQYSRDVFPNHLGSWLPGYSPQASFVDNYHPNIVTISIGGNDVGFKDILERCIGPGNCYGSYEDRRELVDNINAHFDRLVDTYRQVKQSALPDSRIYVVGYPSIVKPAGDCGLRQPVILNQDETVFANLLEDYLNSIIRLAAQKAGVYYVDTTNAFYGHRLCEGSARNRYVNGLTVGRDTLAVFSNGSFHPTMAGHEALEKRIAAATNNLTASMPKGDDAIVEPIADDSLAILQTEHANRPLYEVVYFDVTGDVVFMNKSTTVRFKARPSAPTRERLSPFTPVTAVLHSDPITLGTFMTDAEGNISADITIPDSVPPGIHAIDLYAMGADGNMHDITQTIYVAASLTDYDGDGTPNDEESCVLYNGSAGDMDRDGIDDECDEEVLPGADSVTNIQKGTSAQSLKYNGTSAWLAAVQSEASNGSQVSSGPETGEKDHKPSLGESTTVTIHHMKWPWIVGSVMLVTLTFLLYLRYAKNKS